MATVRVMQVWLSANLLLIVAYSVFLQPALGSSVLESVTATADGCDDLAFLACSSYLGHCLNCFK